MTLPDWVPDWLLESRWVRLGLQAAAVVIVIGLIAVGAWGWYRSQESRGLAALADATALAQKTDADAATPQARADAIKALEGVLADYPRMSSAPQAAYQLGNLKYAATQYAEARGAYGIALAKGATGTVRTLSGMGIGYTWEAEKSYPNAAAAYDAVVKQLKPKDFLYEESLMAEARAQELAGKPAAAIEVYERLLRDVPETRRGEDVRHRIADLRSQSAQPAGK